MNNINFVSHSNKAIFYGFIDYITIFSNILDILSANILSKILNYEIYQIFSAIDTHPIQAQSNSKFYFSH